VIIGYLGMTFDFCVKGEVKVPMANAFAEVLEGCGVTVTRKTPATETLFDGREDSPLFSEKKASVVPLKHCHDVIPGEGSKAGVLDCGCFSLQSECSAAPLMTK